MILLDTDHVNVLKYPDHPRFVSLTTQLNTSADQDVVITVITVEEQMRGWLAWINRSDDVRRQVPAYQELLRLFAFFTRWHVVPFDEHAASAFQGLRAQHIRIGTWTSRLPRLPSSMMHSCSLQIFGISNRFPIYL